jgi:hypothetical protein
MAASIRAQIKNKIMKRKITLYPFHRFFSASCEDVIEVDLDNAPQNWLLKRQSIGKKERPKSTENKTNHYNRFYSTEIPKVSGATVSIKNCSNVVFNFRNQTGELAATFIPVINETYTHSDW